MKIAVVAPKPQQIVTRYHRILKRLRKRGYTRSNGYAAADIRSMAMLEARTIYVDIQVQQIPSKL